MRYLLIGLIAIALSGCVVHHPHRPHRAAVAPATITVLPDTAVKVVIKGRTYWRHKGRHYRWDSHRRAYVVVAL